MCKYALTIYGLLLHLKIISCKAGYNLLQWTEAHIQFYLKLKTDDGKILSIPSKFCNSGDINLQIPSLMRREEMYFDIKQDKNRWSL